MVGQPHGAHVAGCERNLCISGVVDGSIEHRDPDIVLQHFNPNRIHNSIAEISIYANPAAVDGGIEVQFKRAAVAYAVTPILGVARYVSIERFWNVDPDSFGVVARSRADPARRARQSSGVEVELVKLPIKTFVGIPNSEADSC